MTVVQVVLSNMAVNTDVLAPVTSTLDTLKTPCSKLGYLIPVTCQRQLLAHCSRLTIAINVCVYDFIKASPKSNAAQTRMDARDVFTTLIICLRL